MASDLQRLFAIEAREILDGLAAGAAQLEHGEQGAEQLKHLLRLAHTLKGAARVAGYPAIASVVHELEEVLPQSYTREDAALSQLLRLLSQLGAQISELGRVDDEHRAPAAAGAPAVSAPDPISTVRVETAALARLQEQIEAMHRDVSSLAQRHADADRLVRQIEDLRRSLEEIRLVPVSTIAEYLERSAADAAAALGRLVRLHVHGGDLRIELHVLAAIRDALVQAVRNAVAHGIQDPKTRAAAGKPAEGRIDISVESRGSEVTFTCRDDGRGVDVAAVRRLLVAAGRLPAAVADAASSEEVLAALMQHRISSRTQASAHAGRGLGLDLIRDVAIRLRGHATIADDARGGATVTIVVPAAISSIAALRIVSGAAAALVPLDAVRRVARFSRADIEQVDDGATLVIDGRAIPLISLAAVMTPAGAQASETFAVLLGHGDAVTALGTSSPGEVVMTLARSLPPLAAADAVVSAVAQVQSELLPLLDPERLSGTRRAAAVPEMPRPRRAPILVVDDSITTRMLEQSILESAGYEVDTAASAEQALVMARTREYSLFLVDVEMPGMNGFEFLEAARASEDIAAVPAIMVTSRDAEADRRRAAAAGAHSYIVKSAFDQRQLLDAIRGLVS